MTHQLLPLISWAPWAAAPSQWDLGAQDWAVWSGKGFHALGLQWERSRFWGGKFTGALLIAHFGGSFFSPIGDHWFSCPEASPGEVGEESCLWCDFQCACEHPKESLDPCSHHRSAHTTPGVVFPSRCGWKRGWMSDGNAESRTGAATPPFCTQFPKSSCLPPNPRLQLLTDHPHHSKSHFQPPRGKAALSVEHSLRGRNFRINIHTLSNHPPRFFFPFFPI